MNLICPQRLLKNIIYLRKQSNTPLKAIAQAMGVDVRQYQNIESGKTRLDIERVNTIAQFYCKSPVELMTQDLESPAAAPACAPTWDAGFFHSTSI
jgi:transcriptional regulator with XRE-family HTH domain